ncbi:MAG: hypothetical protein R2788_21215 [Saprospiraceae bacterium]
MVCQLPLFRWHALRAVTNSYKDGDRNITTVLPAGRINLIISRTGLAYVLLARVS